jgi:hypothetical protein
VISDADLFWSLGGPRRFLDRVVSTIDARSSMVIAGPDHCGPIDLALAVDERKRHDWNYRTIDLEAMPEDAFIDPHDGVRTMMRTLGIEPPAGNLALGPLAEAGLRGWTMWIDGRSCDDLHLISGLIATMVALTSDLKNRPSQRPVLILEMRTAQLAQVALPSAVPHLMWRGVLDRLDTAVYVRERAEVTLPGPDLFREAVAVEVVGYDLSLADDVLGAWDGSVDSLDEVMEPLRCARNWTVATAPPEPMSAGEPAGSVIGPWTGGWADLWPRGRVHLHAAVLPTRGLFSVEQRIVAAQARELFPEVELRRQELAHWAEQNGIVPVTAGLDLRTADMKELVPDVARVCRMRFPDEADRAQRLLRMRNKVAHRELLSRDEVLDLLAR